LVIKVLPAHRDQDFKGRLVRRALREIREIKGLQDLRERVIKDLRGLKDSKVIRDQSVFLQ